MITLDDAKTGIILGAIKAVRRYGLEGVRIQNISEFAGISSGAIYRVEAPERSRTRCSPTTCGACLPGRITRWKKICPG